MQSLPGSLGLSFSRHLFFDSSHYIMRSPSPCGDDKCRYSSQNFSWDQGLGYARHQSREEEYLPNDYSLQSFRLPSGIRNSLLRFQTQAETSHGCSLFVFLTHEDQQQVKWLLFSPRILGWYYLIKSNR